MFWKIMSKAQEGKKKQNICGHIFFFVCFDLIALPLKIDHLLLKLM